MVDWLIDKRAWAAGEGWFCCSAVLLSLLCCCELLVVLILPVAVFFEAGAVEGSGFERGMFGDSEEDEQYSVKFS